MPRLLNVNNYHYRRGGADAVYFDHAALMAEMGWENAFFAMHHPQNDTSPWSDYFVDELQHGHDYSPVKKVVLATRVVWSVQAQRKLDTLIARFRPDVAHLHNIYHHLSPAILYTLKKAGIPVVLTAHDLKLACPSYSMFTAGRICERCRGGNYLNAIAQRCVQGSRAASAVVAVESFTHRALRSYQRHVDRIVVPSRFFRDKFVDWGWSTRHFTHVPNWLDTSALQPRYEPGNYFVYFGRLADIKGLDTLIRAAAIAGVDVVIAGTGPMREHCEQLATQLQARITFAGFRSGNDLHDLIRNSRASVLPSEWYENAPISVLEAAALGKPVIGSDIGGIPEMVLPGQTGWLFPPGDVQALAAVLTEAAHMPDEALAVLGAAGRELVGERFSRQGYLAAMLDLYASLGISRG